MNRFSIAAGLALALAAGTIDVCVALLHKPQGFETITAVAAPILMTAVLVLPVYLLLAALLRPAATACGIDPAPAGTALAAWMGTAFALALLAGLHTEPVSPQSTFRAAAILVLSAITGAGVYAMSAAMRRDPVWTQRRSAIVVAIPLLLFEVLVYQWLQVYAIDGVTTLLSILVTAGTATVAIGTVAAARSVSGAQSATRILAVFALTLAAVPMLSAIGTRRSGMLHASAATGNATPPRIILITVDTLRADAVSAYRPSAPPTRAIDQLANDGVLFERAIAPAPWTLPSLTSILTGLMPAAHQTNGFAARLSKNVTTLAEYLADHGYDTAAVVHNDLLNPRNGLSQGFADYHLLREQFYSHSLGMGALQTIAPSVFVPPTWPSNDDQTAVADDWLEAHRDRNFFLWVHYFDPHAPYAPPNQYRTAEPLPTIGASFDGQKSAAQGFFVASLQEREAVRSLYDGEVRYIDANIGRLLATLKRLQLYDNALVVFTSDHGEEFWEHGRVGHGHSVYDELLHVPLIVKLPGGAHRGRATATVSTASVAPTILDLSGVHYDAGNVSAPSLYPLIDPAAGHYTDRTVTAGAQIMFDRRETVLFDHFKYIVSTVDAREELFDLTDDAAEQRSLGSAQETAREMGRRLLRESRTAAAGLRKRLGIEEGAIQADEDTVRRLRTLGYLR